ncbi:hypothetical protein SO802_023694 [Lithocarpus litseifolius]|uniref:Purple acid phosphatase n=1 Tax=Lithocarpus litseifolius TaxID=425828 RepID=A0AAW2C6X7_9ROSI
MRYSDVLQAPEYKDTGKGYLKLQLIHQRSDFSFTLFSGGLSNPKLVAVSNQAAFANPNAPVYPRLAKDNGMNGYGINEAGAFVEWAPKGGNQVHSPAGTSTFDRNSMSYDTEMHTHTDTHISFQQAEEDCSKAILDLVGNCFPDRKLKIVFAGVPQLDEADGSNEYNNFQRGSLNSTRELIRDLKNIDIVFHIGDICYANGYISQWDQFTAQVEPIASTVPYMIASGNYERDWPGTGSFYGNMDSGGEYGVLAETMFYVPTENRAKFCRYQGYVRHATKEKCNHNICLDARLSDIYIGTSAAPTYLPAYQFNNQDNEGNVRKFNLIDGGVAANNRVYNHLER